MLEFAAFSFVLKNFFLELLDELSLSGLAFLVGADFALEGLTFLREFVSELRVFES